MGKLSVKKIDSILKKRELGFANDGDGLYLRVREGKGDDLQVSWVFRYRLDGKQRSQGLGPYPQLGLAEARELATTAARLKVLGTDPIEQKRAAAEAAKRETELAAQKAITFAELAAEYIESHRAGWRNVKHGQQWQNTLSTYAFPVIGELPPSQITTDHLLEVLRPIWTEKTETASRVRNRIELVWNYAKARGLCHGENPALWRGHLDALLPKPSKVATVKHHEAMPYQDVPQFMVKLGSVNAMSARALELIILTACRSGEALGASWDEIDLGERVWAIPEGRMKGEKAHTIPLCDRAIELLKSLPRVKGNPFVFPGARPGRPVSAQAVYNTTKLHGGETITIHGFRSSFRDWAADKTTAQREVIEMSLAHVVAQGSEAAYWRGDVLDKRRDLIEEWAGFITLPTDNVLMFKAV